MKQVRQILVGFDGSAMSEEAVKRAISIAKSKNAELFVVHGIESPMIESLFNKTTEKSEIKKGLEEKIGVLNRKAAVPCVTIVEYGEPAGVISEMVKRLQPDLLVLGGHGKDDLESNRFGTTLSRLLQTISTPLLIVKSRAKKSYINAIVPTDLSEGSKKSLDFTHALFPDSSTTLLYAGSSVSDIEALLYHTGKEEHEQLRHTMAEDSKGLLNHFNDETGLKARMKFIELTASVNDDLLEAVTEDDADLVVLNSDANTKEGIVVEGDTVFFLLQESPIDVLIYKDR